VSVTVRDIVVAAGVSPGTASRALRGHPLISVVCISRIRQVAEALGYRPLRDGRIAADALIAAGHTRLAIVNPKADHTMFAVREHGFREAAAERSATVASFTAGSGCWRVPTAAGFAEECLAQFWRRSRTASGTDLDHLALPEKKLHRLAASVRLISCSPILSKTGLPSRCSTNRWVPGSNGIET